jgi:hypothetical protein
MPSPGRVTHAAMSTLMLGSGRPEGAAPSNRNLFAGYPPDQTRNRAIVMLVVGLAGSEIGLAPEGFRSGCSSRSPTRRSGESKVRLGQASPQDRQRLDARSSVGSPAVLAFSPRRNRNSHPCPDVTTSIAIPLKRAIDARWRARELERCEIRLARLINHTRSPTITIEWATFSCRRGFQRPNEVRISERASVNGPMVVAASPRLGVRNVFSKHEIPTLSVPPV